MILEKLQKYYLLVNTHTELLLVNIHTVTTIQRPVTLNLFLLQTQVYLSSSKYCTLFVGSRRTSFRGNREGTEYEHGAVSR